MARQDVDSELTRPSRFDCSAREYSNLILDTCQMEDSIQTVKREDNSNDPENGSPDGDRGGKGHQAAIRPPADQRASKPRRRVKQGV